MIKILFICYGNICRSTMAEFVMKDLVKKAGLSEQFHIESAATSREEIGNPVHHGTRKKLAEHGISCAGKTARQMTAADYARFDLLIGMDNDNFRQMNRICGGDPDGKLYKLLWFVECDKWGSPESRRAAFGEEEEQGSSARKARTGVSSKSGLRDDVADPWYTGDFEATWQDVSLGCAALLKRLSE